MVGADQRARAPLNNSTNTSTSSPGVLAAGRWPCAWRAGCWRHGPSALEQFAPGHGQTALAWAALAQRRAAPPFPAQYAAAQCHTACLHPATHPAATPHHFGARGVCRGAARESSPTCASSLVVPASAAPCLPRPPRAEGTRAAPAARRRSRLPVAALPSPHFGSSLFSTNSPCSFLPCTQEIARWPPTPALPLLSCCPLCPLPSSALPHHLPLAARLQVCFIGMQPLPPHSLCTPSTRPRFRPLCCAQPTVATRAIACPHPPPAPLLLRLPGPFQLLLAAPIHLHACASENGGELG